MRILRVGERDWELVREVRLAALRDALGGLGENLDREERFTAKHWQMRLRSSPTWLALDSYGAGLGIVGMIHEPASPVYDRHLVGLWVDPGHRRQGIGWALADTVRAAAAEEGAQTLSLWIGDENLAAVDLCVRAGFQRTGERQRRPRDPELTEERYVLALTAPAGSEMS